MKNLDEFKKQIKQALDLKLFHSPKFFSFVSFFDSPWKLINRHANSALRMTENLKHPGQFIALYEEIIALQSYSKKLEWFNMSDEQINTIKDLQNSSQKAILENVPANIIMENIITCEKRLKELELYLTVPSKRKSQIQQLEQDKNNIQELITGLKSLALKRGFQEACENKPLHDLLKKIQDYIVPTKQEKVTQLRQKFNTEGVSKGMDQTLQASKDLGCAMLLVLPVFTAVVSIFADYWNKFQQEHKKIIQGINNHCDSLLTEQPLPSGYNPWLVNYLKWHTGISELNEQTIFNDYLAEYKNQQQAVIPSI